MSDPRELYQEMILDHGRHPRNFRFPEGANLHAEGHNPLCGDRLTVKLVLEDGVVQDIGFQGAGCAISTAAASTMTEAVKGKTRAEVERLSEAFRALVTGKKVAELPPKLRVFAGVSEFPMRVKCATLAWHTLEAALGEKSEPVTTEDNA
jgi:SUF system NifU family Fe-S assembly protein